MSSLQGDDHHTFSFVMLPEAPSFALTDRFVFHVEKQERRRCRMKLRSFSYQSDQFAGFSLCLRIMWEEGKDKDD